MAAALRKLGVDFEEIDVDSDPRLDQLYGADVPVLQTEDGKELCRHRLTPEAIRLLGKSEGVVPAKAGTQSKSQ